MIVVSETPSKDINATNVFRILLDSDLDLYRMMIRQAKIAKPNVRHSNAINESSFFRYIPGFLEPVLRAFQLPPFWREVAPFVAKIPWGRPDADCFIIHPYSDIGQPFRIRTWYFRRKFHAEFFADAADRWNQEHPDKRIVLEPSVLPYDNLHNKLLVAIQSGVGASVVYYNMDHLNAAGVRPQDIDYWTTYYVEAAKKVKAATGKYMTTFESNDQWSFWPMISQQKSDYFDKAGNCILDNDINVKTLQFQYDMIYKHNVAALPPGGFHHTEEFYGFLNAGQIASLLMPMWYMGRFTDFCPDLSGKMLVQPMPRWEQGGFRSAGMGGTGTAVTLQCKNVDVATEFVCYSKVTKEANIRIWQLLGFDPPRWDVWDSPELKAKNKYTDYFVNGTKLFETLLQVKDEIMPVNVTEKMPKASDLIKSAICYRVLQSREKTPYEALHEAAEEVRK